MEHLPEKKLPQMFQKNGKLARVYRFSLLAQRDDLPERIERSARRQLGAETRLGWKSSGLPTRVSQASALPARAPTAPMSQNKQNETITQNAICNSNKVFNADVKKSSKYESF